MDDLVIITGKKMNGDIYREEIPKDIESFGIDWQDDLISLDLSGLQHCKKITKISFQMMDNVRQIDISPLSHCSELEEILFSQMGLIEIDLSPLANCIALKTLTFDYISLKTIDLTPLQNCPAFESLSLSHGELRHLDLSPLAYCKNFKSLILWRNPLNALDLSSLSDCNQLEIVFLEDNKLTEVDLTFLENCVTLKELNLENNYLKQIDLSPLINCTKLEYINLTANLLEELDLSPLSNSQSLEFIDLCHNKQLRKIDLTSFNAPSFEKLEAFWCGLEEINLEGLKNSKNFKYLLLKGNVLKAIDLSPLKTIKIEIIDLSSNILDSIDLSPLGSCSNLSDLYLTDNDLVIIDLTPLSACSNLKSLVLNENQLTTVNLAPIANCSQLNILSLENNLLESIDLKPVSSLLELSQLKLAQNPLIGLDDCCDGEKSCPVIINLPLLATGELDLEPLASCSKLSTISYDFGCKILHEDKLPKPISKIVYTHLTGSHKDGTPKYLLYNTMDANLELLKQGLKTIDLSPIHQFQKLKVLDISVNLLKNIDLENVKSTSLRIFNGSLNLLAGLDLKILRRNCANLEVIKLAYNEFSSLDIEALAGWEKLKTIDLTGNVKLSLDLKPLASCPELDKIIVSQEMVLKNIDLVQDKLEINDNPIIRGERKDGSKFIGEVNQVKDEMSAFIQVFSEDLTSIDFNSAKEILPIVTTIRLPYLDLQTIDLAPLAKCTKLTALELTGNDFTEIDLTPLKNCFELENLSLSFCENLKEIDITPLLNLKNLKEFYLNDETKIYANRSALQGDLPVALKDWYSDEIIWN